MSRKENGLPCGGQAVLGGVEAVWEHHDGSPAPRQPSPYRREFDAGTLATADECRQVLAEVDSEMEHIRSQLTAAISHRQATGERSDPHWFGKARIALGIKGKIRQRVQERLGVLNRAERQAAAKAGDVAAVARAWAFYRAAKKMLTAEEFAVLEELARAELAAREDAA